MNLQFVISEKLKKMLQFIKSVFTRHYDKIIFLDFDGVLCPINDEIDDGKDRFGTIFNTECAKQFNYIIAATDAKIVITSSWRQYLSLWQLRRMWRKRNMAGKIVGITTTNSVHRGEEIDYWLKKNKYCGQHVILDDMNFRQFNDHHRNKLITCNGRIGLTTEDAIRVINIFVKPKANEKLRTHTITNIIGLFDVRGLFPNATNI